MQGKTIVLTGGSSGIGAAAAKLLRAQGAHVVITGRSPETAYLAKEVGCDYRLVDYNSLASVRQLASTLLHSYPRIDVLVNNIGGLMASEKRLSADGHEASLQVNHLGGFLLTLLLQRRLEQSQGAVINTASMAHKLAKLDLDDLGNNQNYRPLQAYARAKLMNILHADEINWRFKGVVGVSFHPGAVATAFGRDAGGIVAWAYTGPLKKFLFVPPEQGADTLVWLCASQGSNSWLPGGYYVRRKLARKSPQARSSTLARQLWEASLALVGTTKSSPSC